MIKKFFNYNYEAKNKHIKSIDKIVNWNDFTHFKMFRSHVILKNNGFLGLIL